mmetsp:Transcript_37657/g.107002  ORF Transcript_37657/g.107002 Transcript_37657/m.107002 type:complete len:242 (-) Transcript_37657:891-1616(-)
MQVSVDLRGDVTAAQVDRLAAIHDPVLAGEDALPRLEDRPHEARLVVPRQHQRPTEEGGVRRLRCRHRGGGLCLRRRQRRRRRCGLEGDPVDRCAVVPHAESPPLIGLPYRAGTDEHLCPEARSGRNDGTWHPELGLPTEAPTILDAPATVGVEDPPLRWRSQVATTDEQRGALPARVSGVQALLRGACCSAASLLAFALRRPHLARGPVEEPPLFALGAVATSGDDDRTFVIVRETELPL